MNMHKFLIIIEAAGENFSSYSPDLPGCVATGALGARSSPGGTTGPPGGATLPPDQKAAMAAQLSGESNCAA